MRKPILCMGQVMRKSTLCKSCVMRKPVLCIGQVMRKRVYARAVSRENLFMHGPGH